MLRRVVAGSALGFRSLERSRGLSASPGKGRALAHGDPLDLDELLPQVERFTLDELIPALARGGALSMDERQAIAARCSRYSGLSAQAFLDHSLAVPTSFFWKELLRGKGLTVGRLDSRYRGLEVEDAGERPDFDPALTSWNHSFTPAINHYLRDVLGIETELEYWRMRMAKFNSITEQLKARDCKIVLGVLGAAKSRVLKKWKQLDNQITDANNEAKDNVK